MQYKIQPWAHQLLAIERAKLLNSFGLFFEMGAGKTGTAINIFRQKCYQEERLLRTLIFAPPVVLENWKREFSMHSDLKPGEVVILSGSGANRCSIFRSQAFTQLMDKNARVFVTNYESLQMKGLFELMLMWQPEMAIFDESHKLKDPTTKRSKQMAILVDGDVKKNGRLPKNYRKPVKYRLCLSGTPVLNSPMDLFGQFRVLDSGETFGKNQFVFRALYFYDANAAFKNRANYFPDWKIKPDSMEKISKLIESKSMSVKKSACLDLPPLIKQRLFVEMSPDQKRLYNDMKKDLVAYLGDKACIATMALTKALRLLQIASGYIKLDDGTEKSLGKTPKMEALYDLLEEATPNSKVIVWSVFRENYTQIRKVCEDLGVKYVEVHGDVSAAEKQRNVDHFNKDPSVRVFIGHPGSGGIGINLIASDVSIFYSRTFSLEYDLQAEARNYRGGSEIHSKVTRIDLITKDTIEELILEALENKQAIGEALLKSWKDKI